MAEFFDFRTESISAFLGDTSVRLPRFQRRSTWNEEKRFRLALSLFKGYPLGTVVVKRNTSEEIGARRSVTHLIDGRQRRETLERMLNPEEIYAWAKRALRLTGNTSHDDIREAFASYVDDYFFGQEDWEAPDEPDSSAPISVPENSEATEPEDEVGAPVDDDRASPTEFAPARYGGLRDLLDIIIRFIQCMQPAGKVTFESPSISAGSFQASTSWWLTTPAASSSTRRGS